jgi:hypothetical protein
MLLQEECGYKNRCVRTAANGVPVGESLPALLDMLQGIHSVPLTSKVVISIVARFMKLDKRLDDIKKSRIKWQRDQFPRCCRRLSGFLAVADGLVPVEKISAHIPHFAVIEGPLNEQVQAGRGWRRKPFRAVRNQKME